MRSRSILRGTGVTARLAAALVFAVLLLAGAATASAGTTPTWQALTNPPPFNPGAMFLLTDGTVMVQDLGPTSGGSPDWWRLTPDSSGSYVDGTWSRAASMPDGYAPHAYAAAMLPDGRLAVEGGEQLGGVSSWSNLGAIYDPLADAWKAVSPPAGGSGLWQFIGDAPSVVLADGRWMVGDSGTTASADDAILDPTTLTWTTTGAVGRISGNGEVGFSLLPSGKVLSVDVLPPACTARTTETFDPATLAWSGAGLTPAPLVVCGDLNEIGPQLMTYTGKVFAEGATASTDLYTAASGTWSAGPNLPIVGGQQLHAGDSPAALMPDGKVLIAANAGVCQPPTQFFLFDGTSFSPAPANAASGFPNNCNNYMLLLPTGQVLSTPEPMEVFTDPGTPKPAWEPTITSLPTKLATGVTYTLAGLQLNGLSEGAAFGDDYQDSTDYPLVQITNDGTGAVTYARTWGMTNRSIAPGASSCTDFALPSGTPTGSAELRVVANGIASPPVPVTVGAGGSGSHSCPSYTLSLARSGTGSGTVKSSPAGIICGGTCSHDYANGTMVTLTAIPATGSALAGWSGGGCSGTGVCIVTVDGQKSVTATFALIPETLSVTRQGDGAGAVTSAPAGIDCGTGCSHGFAYGSSVTLSASAAAGSSFAGWTGACTGTAGCALTMTAARSVTAAFVKDCVVPRLEGKQLQKAKRMLHARDCSLGRIKRVFSTKVKKGRVISQRPKPRRQLRHGARVGLVVSRGKKR